MRSSVVGVLLASALLAAGLLGAQEPKPAPAQAAQEGGKPAASPPGAKPAPVEAQDPKKTAEAPVVQQDRVDISGLLDSWYQIRQGDSHVGYVHEVLDRAPATSAWRYNYSVEAEVELFVPDPKDARRELPSVESHRIRAKLDDTYAPIEMERVDNKDGAELRSFVSFSQETGRKIDVLFSASDRTEFKPPAEEEIYYTRFLMFIALRQSGNLARPGPRKATLFVPREDGSMPLVEVQFNVEGIVKKEYAGKKDVAVTRVLYMKAPPAPDRNSELFETYVDRFGRVMEETTRGAVRRVLVKGEEEAVGQGTVLRQGARRDPFRKDLALISGTGGTEKKAGTEVVRPIDPSNFLVRLKEAETGLEELQKAKEENREKDGEDIYQRILSDYEQLKRVTREQPPEVVRRVDDLRRKAEEIWGGAERVLTKMKAIYVKIYEYFEKDDVPKMEEGLTLLRKAQERPEIKGAPQELVITKMVSELEPLLTKSRTRLELAKKRLVVTGTMSYDEEVLHPIEVQVNVFGVQVGVPYEVRFVKPSRLAIINEKQYKVGDVVEVEGVRVDKISSHGIQVSLKDETRDVGIRQ